MYHSRPRRRSTYLAEKKFWKLLPPTLKLRRFLPVSLMFCLLVFAVTWHRMQGFLQSNSSGNIWRDVTYFFSLSSDTFSNTDAIVRYVEKKGLLHGHTYLDIVYFFIPHRFWPEKPLSNVTARAVYPVSKITGQGYNFGLLGNGFVNFGWIGAITATILWCAIYSNFNSLLISPFQYPRLRAFGFLPFYLFSRMYMSLRLGLLTHFIGYVILHSLFFFILALTLSVFRDIFCAPKPGSRCQ